MNTPRLLLLGLVLTACETTKNTDEDGAITDSAALLEDGDGDGFTGADDCNDADPTVSPGAVEVCDGIDNDCDGAVDEGVLTESFADTDGDGFGDPTEVIEACGTPEGAASNANDCDDTDPAVHLGAAELCNSRDDDCDGDVDEGVTVTQPHRGRGLYPGLRPGGRGRRLRRRRPRGLSRQPGGV